MLLQVSAAAVEWVAELMAEAPVLGAALLRVLAGTDIHDIAALHGDPTLRPQLLQRQVCMCVCMCV